MSDGEHAQLGKVYLVGAGPGDPGLITLRGAQVLGRADVILYDYLASPQILSHARSDAEIICLGRHGQNRVWSQHEINEKLVTLARAGQTVVRLKGGDPAVFARGAEEAEALLANAISFEVVPGITAALAGACYTGVPLTHRENASAVAFVTGQQRSDQPEAALDYDALAHFPGTLVFYMGVTTAPEWTASLIAAGKPPGTPAMIVRRVSFSDQQSIRCTLAEVSRHLHSGSKIRPPVIVMVGEVVDRAPERWWFSQRPLFGTSVMVTRPSGQAEDLAALLAELGAEVVVQPAIRIGEPPDWAAVDAAIGKLSEFDWVVFSSSNGVRYFLDRLKSTGRDLRALAAVKLAAIGPGTSDELARYHLAADLVPREYRAESLAEALERATPAGQRFLLIRASRGREVLSERLAAAGGHVTQAVAYTSDDIASPSPEIRERLARGDIGWVTVTSSAIARSLVHLFGDALRGSRLVSISPVTSGTLRQLGFEPDAEATTYTMQGVADAILAHAGSANGNHLPADATSIRGDD